MKSLNFEFLRPFWPQLAELGGFAESYAHPDPDSSLVMERMMELERDIMQDLNELKTLLEKEHAP